MEIPEPAFFLTDRSLRSQYFYAYSSESRSYTRYPYYPILFETMPGSSIHQYQRRFVRRFLFWGLKNIKNKHKFNNSHDSRIVISRLFDLNAHVLLSILVGLSLNRLLKNISTPFLDMLLENGPISSKTLKKTGSFLIAALFVRDSFKKVEEMTYLFDLAMKYKEEFAEGELVSPNCEEIVRRLTGNREKSEKFEE